MERILTIKQNLVTGEVTWDNPDELTNFEAIGMLEWAKTMIMANIIDDMKE